MSLTLSQQRSLSYRNQCIDLQSKSMDWFLQDRNLRQERVNTFQANIPFRYRSSHQNCSVEIGVLKNFPKFTGNHLRQSLFFNKVARAYACNFIKKETVAQLFSCEFCETFKSIFLTEHLWWLLWSIHLRNWFSDVFNWYRNGILVILNRYLPTRKD